MTEEKIVLCLGNLRNFVNKRHEFYATFFEGASQNNPGKSHSLDHFDYSKEEMIKFGNSAGWESVYIGDWDHPRDQKMMKYTAK